MQTTTYPEDLSESAGSSRGAVVAASGGCAPVAGAAEGGHALDLIREHLTDIHPESEYRPALHGRLVENWWVHEDYKPTPEGSAWVLKRQSFAAGGAEFTCRRINLDQVGFSMDCDRRRGKREKSERSTVDNEISAAYRARRRVRYLVKNMGATNLVTLTVREGPATKGWTDRHWLAWEAGGKDDWQRDNGSFLQPSDWRVMWDKARRNLERILGRFPYVAVLEQHRKGNYHLHISWVGKVNLNVLRRVWRLSCPAAGGNVDSRYIKASSGGCRSSKIARYISKYVTKGFESVGDHEYNKKRYWASRQSMPDLQRYVLRATELVGVYADLVQWLGFRFDDRDNFFEFPDGGGFWWNYVADQHQLDPPF